MALVGWSKNFDEHGVYLLEGLEVSAVSAIWFSVAVNRAVVCLLTPFRRQDESRFMKGVAMKWRVGNLLDQSVFGMCSAR